MTDRMLALDHVMVHVPDAEAAGALFERLGFVATPKSGMPGLSNRLLCFPRTDTGAGVCNYVELMQLEDPLRAPPPMPQLLVAMGAVSTVLSVTDAAAVVDRLRGQGLRLGPALDLARDWHLPDGTTITPSFRVAIPEIGQAPVYWNFCQHKTPELYVRPEFTVHANGAQAITRVWATDPDPEAAARHYVAYWGADWDGRDIRLRHGPALRLLTPEALEATLPGSGGSAAPGIKGMTIRVADAGRAAAIARAAGFTPVETPEGPLIPAPQAAGCFLLYSEGADA